MSDATNSDIARRMISERAQCARELQHWQARLDEIDRRNTATFASDDGVTALDIARAGLAMPGKNSWRKALKLLRHSVWASLTLAGSNNRWNVLRAKVTAGAKREKAGT